MVVRTIAFKDATWDDWHTVTIPKVKGTINLHHAIREQPLGFFICLSSVIGIVGYPKEAIYAASNSFQDGLCRIRGAQGLHAASISLPAMSDVCYIAEHLSNGDKGSIKEKFGISMTEEQLTSTVQAICETGPGIFDQLNNNHTTLGIVIEPGLLSRRVIETRLQKQINKLCSDRFLSSTVAATANSTGDSKHPSLCFRQTIQNEVDYKKTFKLVADALTQKISADNVPLETKLSELHLDSLRAVELCHWMHTDLNATVPLLELMNCNTLENLVTKLMQLSTLVNAKVPMASAIKDVESLNPVTQVPPSPESKYQ